MKEIYIIFEFGGSYEDYYRHNLYAVTDEETAKQRVKLLKESAPKIPFSDQPSKLEALVAAMDEFDEWEYVQSINPGGRYWHDLFCVDSPNFISYPNRTEEQKKEAKEWNEWMNKDIIEKRLAFVQIAVPEATQQTIDDYENISYNRWTEPAYSYEKIMLEE